MSIGRCYMFGALFGAPLLLLGSALSHAQDLKLGGFVQFSAQASATSKQVDLRLDEAQLDLTRGWKGVASFRFSTQFRYADNFDARGELTPLTINKLVEQAWVQIDALEKDAGLVFRFGKVALPIGLESINAPSMLQYSRSFSVEVGTPNFGTGMLVGFRRSIFDCALYAITGWNTLTDDNDAKTFGGRLGFSLLDGALRVGLSYVGGPEAIPNRSYVNVRSFRHVLDLDATYERGPLTLGAELNYGYEDRASQVNPDKRARWLSALGLVHYRFLPWLSGTLRYEHADDPDGSRLYMLSSQRVGPAESTRLLGTPLTLDSLTLAALFRLGGGAHAMLEWRTDWITPNADAAVFPAADGALTKTRSVAVASVFYAW